MENIHLPTTVEFVPTDKPHVGQLVIYPCQQGYGTTIGNALRRVLLSSLPGAAIESVKIKGVQHEFSAIEGVQEDMIEIILNLKQVAVKSYSETPVTLSLVKKGKGTVTAGDFSKNADIEIINTDLPLATITSDSATFDMEVTIGRGRGYVPAAEKNTKEYDLGTIAIDSLYTPIRDVGYDISLTRVGDVTDYEKLKLTIETNGTITPEAAVNQSTKILMDHFALILNMSTSMEPVRESHEEIVAPAVSDAASAEDMSSEDAEEKTPKKKKTKKK